MFSPNRRWRWSELRSYEFNNTERNKISRLKIELIAGTALMGMLLFHLVNRKRKMSALSPYCFGKD